VSPFSHEVDKPGVRAVPACTSRRPVQAAAAGASSGRAHCADGTASPEVWSPRAAMTKVSAILSCPLAPPLDHVPSFRSVGRPVFVAKTAGRRREIEARRSGGLSNKVNASRRRYRSRRIGLRWTPPAVARHLDDLCSPSAQQAQAAKASRCAPGTGIALIRAPEYARKVIRTVTGAVSQYHMLTLYDAAHQRIARGTKVVSACVNPLRLSAWLYRRMMACFCGLMSWADDKSENLGFDLLFFAHAKENGNPSLPDERDGLRLGLVKRGLMGIAVPELTANITMRYIPTDPSSQRNTQAIFVPVAMFSHKASEIVQATAAVQACIQARIRCSDVGRKTSRIQVSKTAFLTSIPTPNGDHMAKPPNYKQEKKRREEAQKKKNEQEQQQKAARKNPPVAPQ